MPFITDTVTDEGVGQRLAGHRVDVRSDAEHLVDGGLVLRLRRELDLAVAAPLVDEVATGAIRIGDHGHRQGELGHRVDVDRVEVEHEVRHVVHRPRLVEGEVALHRVDQVRGR